jgi:hypothetical protein
VSLLVPPGLYAGCNIDIVRTPFVAPREPRSLLHWGAPIFLHPRDFFFLVVEMADVDERTRINARERLRYLERRWARRGEPHRYPRSIAEAWSTAAP